MSASAGATVAWRGEITPQREALIREIREGLSQQQKELPSKLFYDRRGSELFNEITRLPEYYLTRAERSLLARHIPGWIAQVRPRSLVEFGAGNADKTRTILDAMLSHDGSHYVPVDISAEYLHESATDIQRQFPRLEVIPFAHDFAGGISLPPDLPTPVVFAILGSTIGNFTPIEAVGLLSQIGSVMGPGDRFLLGVDLRKHPAVLRSAYNDSAGVTAAFNLNLLRVMNQELGADFDLGAYHHCAMYDGVLHRIEMHLIAKMEQQVHVPGAGTFRIEKGETVRTEICCKYDVETVRELFESAGIRMVEWFHDARYALATAVRP